MDRLGRGINRKFMGFYFFLFPTAPVAFSFLLVTSGGATRMRAGLFAGERRAALPPAGISSFLLFENEHSNPNVSCLYLDLWHDSRYIHILYQKIYPPWARWFLVSKFPYMFASPWVLMDGQVIILLRDYLHWVHSITVMIKINEY